MAITVSSIIGTAKERCEGLSDNLALNLLNEVHSDLCADVRLIPDTTLQITNLVAGVREYPLPDNVERMWDLCYATQLGDYQQLRMTSIDELDDFSPGWRETNTTGIPRMVYERGGMLGLWPLPDTTSTGGFPLVSIFCSVSFSPLGINDSLPGHVVTSTPWLYGICERWAAMKSLDSYPGFKTMAAKAKDELIVRTRGRMAREPDRILPDIPRVNQI